MNFEQAWETTSRIGGFFEREEAELYWNVLKSLPPNAAVVEVGLENGKSTSLPAQFSANVRPLTLHCVDNFTTFGAEGLGQFTETMKAFGAGYTLWKTASADMAGQFKDLDLILIDADHDDCEMDCKVWIPMLKPGGWMLFHDYGRDPWSVKDVVDRYCEGWEDLTISSLAARRKPMPEVTP